MINYYDPLDATKLLEEMAYDIDWPQLEALVSEIATSMRNFRQQNPEIIAGVGEMGRMLPEEDTMQLALQSVHHRIHNNATNAMLSENQTIPRRKFSSLHL